MSEDHEIPEASKEELLAHLEYMEDPTWGSTHEEVKKLPLMVDLCADCDKPFWVERGHSGPLYCAYCGNEVAVFE